jgi:hypothetical protein
MKPIIILKFLNILKLKKIKGFNTDLSPERLKRIYDRANIKALS